MNSFYTNIFANGKYFNISVQIRNSFFIQESVILDRETNVIIIMLFISIVIDKTIKRLKTKRILVKQLS